MNKAQIFNVLADRYASRRMTEIWSPRNQVIQERELWIAGMEIQRDLGREIPQEAIDDYRSVVSIVNLDSIAQRELITQHDVTARIEEFNALAGGLQYIHGGFTARDPTDNTEQWLIRQSLEFIRNKIVALLGRLGYMAWRLRTIDICGRTHFVPAQTTTLGKRFAMWTEELLIAFQQLQQFILTYPLRGIKGPVGTHQDMTQLLGSQEKAQAFEIAMAKRLGFTQVIGCVGQVYPRSLDFATVSLLNQLASAPGNMAKGIRLMAGLGLMHEGFKPGQTGSSAMPHKVNSRTCERICGFVHILGGYLAMAQSLLGDQWLEGDVSCSVIRRVAIPDAFFTIDGLLEASLTVLDEMEVFEKAVEVELQRNLPFLSSTKMLMAAVKKGMGRQDAHKSIKGHAIGAVKKGKPQEFVDSLSADQTFPLNAEEIGALIATPDSGRAIDQAEDLWERVERITDQYPEAAQYSPEPIR